MKRRSHQPAAKILGGSSLWKRDLSQVHTMAGSSVKRAWVRCDKDLRFNFPFARYSGAIRTERITTCEKPAIWSIAAPPCGRESGYVVQAMIIRTRPTCLVTEGLGDLATRPNQSASTEFV